MVKGWGDNFSSTEFRTSFARGNAVKEKRLRTDLVDIVNVNGFGNFDIFPNNSEDFALYCKTSFLVLDKSRMGMTGQACSLISATFTALLSSPLNMSRQQRVGLATLTVGTYFLSRYVADIGVRSDVSKVAVEDLAVNFVRSAIANKE
ncbi:hypothetical protein IFM89_023118 [Coptis chinensis]|uniref:Uncharacterized protein n=1 Tax=Coptis chinensis TaxID=261450 RepID=A0A835HSD2_9MAGN|nr:hypothetical protein IFM89_023118 [Coptis chinensis]